MTENNTHTGRVIVDIVRPGFALGIIANSAHQSFTVTRQDGRYLVETEAGDHVATVSSYDAAARALLASVGESGEWLVQVTNEATERTRSAVVTVAAPAPAPEPTPAELAASLGAREYSTHGGGVGYSFPVDASRSVLVTVPNSARPNTWEAWYSDRTSAFDRGSFATVIRSAARRAAHAREAAARALSDETDTYIAPAAMHTRPVGERWEDALMEAAPAAEVAPAETAPVTSIPAPASLVLVAIAERAAESGMGIRVEPETIAGHGETGRLAWSVGRYSPDFGWIRYRYGSCRPDAVGGALATALDDLDALAAAN